MPVALVAAVVIVAVYWVAGERAADVVKVAIVCAVFMATVPATVVPPTVCLSVNVVAGEMIVAGSIARLKVAVINLPLLATPVVLVVAFWLPLAGLDEVTVGIVAPATVHVPPGGIGDTVGTVGSAGANHLSVSPPCPPHPVTKKTLRINMINIR
jgi:hypothetical protein